MAEWARDLILPELEHARDRGESSVTTADLREASGVGHDEFEEAIGELVEAGSVEQFAPGEWALYERSEGSPEGPGDIPADPILEEAGRRGREAAPPAVGEGDSVRMTRSMVQALSDEALGQIVKAGMEGAPGEFTFTVA